MIDLKLNTTLACIDTTSMTLKRRRRKRRNYSAYRDYTVIDLHAVLCNSLTDRPDLLERFFPKPEHKPSHPTEKNSHFEYDSEHHFNATDDSEIDNAINCPFQTPDEALVPIHGAFYFHIRSKINLGKKILNKEESKTILEEQCLHYARACKVGLVNYSIQDDHFHMLIAVQTSDYFTAREKASKMIGCIKQQFTKRFKHWYNEIYVREQRHRIKPIPKGTLWDARAEIEFIANETELMACVLYVESNYLKIRAAAEIQELETPPIQSTCSNGLRAATYQTLEQYLVSHKFQSCDWYINGRKGHTTALSDGTDGRWLTGQELEYWWNKSVKSYPPGWRKVWFKKGGGILINTHAHQRRYHKNPILDLLDEKPSENGRILKHLVFAICWQNRTRVWVSDSKTQNEPGVTEF